MTKNNTHDEKLNGASARLLMLILPSGLLDNAKLDSKIVQKGLRSLEKRIGWANTRSMMRNAICETYGHNWLIEECFKYAASKRNDWSEPFFLEIISNNKNHVAQQMAIQTFAECCRKEKVLETLLDLFSKHKDDFIICTILARCLSKFKSDKGANLVGSALIRGTTSRLDKANGAELSLTPEYEYVRALAAMKTETSISWLCAAHMKDPDCMAVKKPILKMPKKAMPFLLKMISAPGNNHAKANEVFPALIVELGYGQSSLGMFIEKLKSGGSEPERHGITNAIIALRKALEPSVSKNRHGPPGEISPNTLDLKRFPTKNPRADGGTAVALPNSKKVLL